MNVKLLKGNPNAYISIIMKQIKVGTKIHTITQCYKEAIYRLFS